MSFESTTLGKLTASAGVTALVDADSIYSSTAPQDPDSPFIVFTRISTLPSHSTDNGQTGANRCDNIRLQVTCYQREADDAIALAEAIRKALEGSSGTIYILTDQRADYDDLPDLHGQIMEFSCWHPSTS